MLGDVHKTYNVLVFLTFFDKFQDSVYHENIWYSCFQPPKQYLSMIVDIFGRYSNFQSGSPMGNE